MTAEETIITLKEQYNRTLRKQLVKAMLEDEKQKLSQTQTTHMINQIFSYVLENTNWNITHNSAKWDTPQISGVRD